jgi:flavin-dependent dehydrogenase
VKLFTSANAEAVKEVMESQTPLSADVIIVGAGPGGATTATYLARAGLDVLLLEKTNFPREKVCGDGLTPRAVKQLINLGIDTSESAGWLHAWRSHGRTSLRSPSTDSFDRERTSTNSWLAPQQPPVRGSTKTPR